MGADSEVERLLLRIIPHSPLKGQCYAVGGYVRDEVLGIESQDLDVAVEKPGGARELAHWLHGQFPAAVSNPHELGAGYPIWQVVFKMDVDGFKTAGAEIEIADTQAESFPDPNTRQRVTVYGDLSADCKRRDFTVNMLYRDLTTGQIIDPSGAGLDDIKRGVLRGHPQVDLNKIFSDDPLRMVRLVRFHAKYAWQIPDEALATVTRNVARVKILSAERVRDELTKIMRIGKLAVALELMRTTGLLAELFPELLPMIGCGQDRIYHSEGDVWVHTLRVISNSPPTVPLQLAALLHDAGKPAARTEVGERVKFIGHETVSVGIAENFLARFKFESALSRKVSRLVALHLRGGDATQWSRLKPARRLIREADSELSELLQLIEADSKSSLGPDGQPRLDHLPVLREALAKATVIPVQKKPVLNGNEIMAAFGLKPGPEIRQALNALLEWGDEAADRGETLGKEAALARLSEKFRSRG